MTEKTHIKVLFIGFGNVGKKIADIIVFEKNKFPELKGLKINIVGIITRSKGSLANQKGVNISRALKEIKSIESFSPSNPDFCQMNGCRTTEELDYDVMVELSTLSIAKKGEPSISYNKIGPISLEVKQINKFQAFIFLSFSKKNPCLLTHLPDIISCQLIFLLCFKVFQHKWYILEFACFL